MATGDAKKAPMSVPRTNEPSGEHFNDLAAFLAGKSSVTLKSNAKKNITGHGPGDDMSEHPRVVNPPPGAIVRASMGASLSDPQNARTIAYQVARGNFDIVDDKEFDKAAPHADVWDEHNAERAAVELKNMDTPQAGTLLAVMADQIAKLQAEPAILADQVSKLQAEVAELRAKK